jgi:hypothetical protein
LSHGKNPQRFGTRAPMLIGTETPGSIDDPITRTESWEGSPMAKRIGTQAGERPEDEDRRCTITLSADTDLRLSVYAKRHRMTRSQAATQAIKTLVRGMRLSFGDAAMSEEGEAA